MPSTLAHRCSIKSPLVDYIAFLSLRQEIRSNAVTEEKQYGDCCGENGCIGGPNGGQVLGPVTWEIEALLK